MLIWNKTEYYVQQRCKHSGKLSGSKYLKCKTYKYIYIYIYICIYIYIYIYVIYIHEVKYVFIFYIYLPIYIYIYICLIYVHIYIYIYLGLFLYIYIYTKSSMSNFILFLLIWHKSAYWFCLFMCSICCFIYKTGYSLDSRLLRAVRCSCINIYIYIRHIYILIVYIDR